MAQNQGYQTTKQIQDQSRRVEQIDADIALFDPQIAPLVTLLNKLNKRIPVKGPKFGWDEDDYVARWASNGSTAIANDTTSTTVTVADGTLFVPGDMFVVPKLVSSSTKPEVCRVTARNSNVLTVVRDVGGAGVDTIDANGALRLLGTAHEEYGALPTAKTTATSRKWNYTQIERTATSFANTAIATETYGASQGERAREHKKKMVEHKQKINAAALWGLPSEEMTGGPNSRPIRTAGGLRNRIATNITDASGTLTRKKLDEFARQCFRYGSDEKILLAAPVIKGAINEWASSHLMVKPAAKRFGVSIVQVETAYGRWALVLDWMLENGVSGKNGFGGLAFSIDLDELWYAYLSNNNVNRDTHVTLDAIKDGGDGKTDEILTEFSFKCKLEKYHGMLYNVTDYMG